MGRRKIKKDTSVDKGESNPRMPTRQSRSQCAYSVISNPLLLDKIVKYSIYKSNGKEADNKTIYAVRLVSKSFLQCTSRILKKSGDWLFELDIHDNSCQESLDEILPVFSKTSRSVDSILPISVDIAKFYFRKINSKSLRNLFEQLSDIISKLCLAYPLDGGSMNLKLNNLNFPILHTLDFNFYQVRQSNKVRLLNLNPENNANGLSFLQYILQNSPNLQRFDFQNDDDAAVNVSSLILPGTIKEVGLYHPVTESQMTFLFKNNLPNLNALIFKIIRQSELQLVYSILEHFQKQLITLSMETNNYNDNDSIICLKFPLLEKLRVLTLSGCTFRLFPEMRHVCSSLVPNLTSVVFKAFSEPVVLDFLQGLPFDNVTSLLLSEYFEVTLPILSDINGSFPNIHTLALRFSLDDTSGFKYLFETFIRLKNLKLNIYFGGSHNLLGYTMVSILLGISQDQATSMVDKTENGVDVPINNTESIMNLRELRSLTLRTVESGPEVRQKNVASWNIICRYGLDKMPSLKQINLLEGFEMWQRE